MFGLAELLSCVFVVFVCLFDPFGKDTAQTPGTLFLLVVLLWIRFCHLSHMPPAAMLVAITAAAP